MSIVLLPFSSTLPRRSTPGWGLKAPAERQTARYHASYDIELLLCYDSGMPVGILAADNIIYSISLWRLQQDCGDTPPSSIGTENEGLEIRKQRNLEGDSSAGSTAETKPATAVPDQTEQSPSLIS